MTKIQVPEPENVIVFLLEELLDLAETLLPTDKDRLAHIKQVLEAERSKPLAEPEIPEEVKDLMWLEDDEPGPTFSFRSVNEGIVEAFRRGQRSKG